MKPLTSSEFTLLNTKLNHLEKDLKFIAEEAEDLRRKYNRIMRTLEAFGNEFCTREHEVVY